MKLTECSIWVLVCACSQCSFKLLLVQNMKSLDNFFSLISEPQVRSICNHVRPDRQTLLFSATFKKRVEKLARDILTDPIRIVQGDVGEANEDVTQIVLVLSSLPAKWTWLLGHIVEFLSTGSVLIFVTKKVCINQRREQNTFL